MYDLRHYFWDDPHLYKEGVDGIIRRCVPEHEQGQILQKCHSEAVATRPQTVQSLCSGVIPGSVMLTPHST